GRQRARRELVGRLLGEVERGRQRLQRIGTLGEPRLELEHVRQLLGRRGGRGGLERRLGRLEREIARRPFVGGIGRRAHRRRGRRGRGSAEAGDRIERR